VHDLGLDADARSLGVELEDLVQGGEVARVDFLLTPEKCERGGKGSAMKLYEVFKNELT
jgi:hypothetical protein